MTQTFGLKTLFSSALLLALSVAPIAAQTPKTPRLTDDEVVAFLENAKTPADHERLATYYEQVATDLDKTAARHKQLAAIYRKMPEPGTPRIAKQVSFAAHCDAIAAGSIKDAKEARTMAEHHRMLAKGPSSGK